MSAAEQHRPGVNKPISTAGPTPIDSRVDTELEAYMQANSIVESEEGEERRAKVVTVLQDMLRQWVVDVGVKKGLFTAEEFGSIDGAGLLSVFGSQRLGVHGPDSDIDVLCVCPQFITRHDFFVYFCMLLHESPHASMVLAVPEAYTPVVKFNFMEQPVDMIFVALPVRSIPSDIDLLDDALLKEQDEKGVRSLNGVRVAQYLVSAVPNFDVFRSALRAIKFWGRRRGIYSNVLGFLGGINFALLVAFVCQLHPNTCTACIVQRFFKIYFHWVWPNPIMVAPPADYQFGSMVSWNYMKHMKDRADLMPIVTPAVPQMNSAYNMSPPQFRAIQEEIMRGHSLLTRWPKESSLDMWVELFSPGMPSFLTKFPRYVQVDIISQSGESNHRRWFSWCESRMRLLLKGIEMPNVIFCHPITNCYHRKIGENEIAESTPTAKPGAQLADEEEDGGVAVQPSSTYSSARSSYRTDSGAETSSEKYSSSFFMGLTFCNGLRSVDLTSTIQDFVYRVSIFDGKTPDMNVAVTALQGSALPEFALDMYEDSANVKMTPLKTPVRPRTESEALSSPPSMVIPASAMSLVAPADSIAPSIGSSGSIAKTLWRDADVTRSGSLSIEEEGWIDGSMDLGTPAVSASATDCGSKSSSGVGRRRDRGVFTGAVPSEVPPLAPIDILRTRTLSFDNARAADTEDDISPYKRSRPDCAPECLS